MESPEIRALMLSEANQERFWSKVQKGPGCWKWTGDFYPNGRPYLYLLSDYQTMVARKRTVVAYRIVYTLLVGDIPKGKCLHHKCENGSCINPFHLQPKTLGENILLSSTTLASINRANTHCIRGHPLTAATSPMYLRIRKNGHRACRICAYWTHRLTRLDQRLYAWYGRVCYEQGLIPKVTRSSSGS